MQSTISSSVTGASTESDCSVSQTKANKQQMPLETEQNVTTAASKAMAIVELAEMITLQLPPKDIVAVQRIDKLWENVSKRIISRSPYLSTAFSTSPAPPKGYVELHSSAGNITAGYHLHYTQDRTRQPSKAILQIHPAISLQTRHADQLKEMVLTINPSHLLSWGAGSWRNMFLTQPPIFCSDVLSFGMGVEHLSGGYRPGGRHDVVPFDVPLTLGILHAVAVELAGGRLLLRSRYATALKITLRNYQNHRQDFIDEGSDWVRLAKEGSMQSIPYEYWD